MGRTMPMNRRLGHGWSWHGLVACACLAMVACHGAAADDTGQRTGAAQSQPRRQALVIGNGNYRSLAPLPNARNDAQDLCARLRGLGFETECDLDIHSRKDFRESVRRFTGHLSPNSVAFFYYAGHGVQVEGENYLLPVDVDIRTAADIEDEGLSLSYLLRSLEETRSAPNIVILDACRDNPVRSRTDVIHKQGLARVDPPVGTVLVYATAPNRAAIDGIGRNGLFAKYLILNLAKPVMRLDELLRAVAEGVEEEARTAYHFEQVPYRSSSYSGTFCLTGCESPELTQRLDQIQRQRDELTQRLQQLAKENEALRTQAEQGNATVEELKARINQLSKQAGQDGGRARAAQQELELTRAQLGRMEDIQKERQAQAQTNEAREAQLVTLHQELQKQAAEIEQYRRRINELTTRHEGPAPESKSSRPNDQGPRPVMVPPSF